MRRKRRMLVWATAGASLAVLVIVAVVVHTVGAWVITAVLAGAASVVASGVAKLADRGAAQGRELVGGRSDPLTVTAKFEVGPLLKIREDLRPDGWEYMAASQQNVRLLIEAVEDQAVILGGLRILVESRQPPLDGELMIPHAALPLRTFDVDLDEESPRPVPRANTP